MTPLGHVTGCDTVFDVVVVVESTKSLTPLIDDATERDGRPLDEDEEKTRFTTETQRHGEEKTEEECRNKNRLTGFISLQSIEITSHSF